MLVVVSATYALGAGNEPITPVPVQNASFYTHLQTFLRGELAAILRTLSPPAAYVASGGLHGISGSGPSPLLCTTAPFALEAFTTDANRITADGGGGPVSIDYEAPNIGANCANPGSDVCWVVGSAQGQTFSATNTRQVLDMPTLPGSAFNRVGTSNIYVDCTSATQPSLPEGSVWLMKTTITNSQVTAVADLRPPASYALRGVFEPTDPLYGALPTGAHDDTAAIQAAEDARSAQQQLYGQVRGGVLSFGAGTFLISAPIVIKSAGTVKGQGTNSILLATNLDGDTFNTSGMPGGFFSGLTIRDLTFTPSAPKTGGAAIHAVTATPTEDAQQNLTVQNITCNAQYVCIHLANSTYTHILSNTIGAVQHTGILVRTSSNWDAGDNEIQGNTIATTPPAGVQGMLFQTSGQRVTNNKILGFPIGIHVNPDPAPGFGDMMIGHNSIENFTQYGILVQTGLVGTQVANLQINSNQFSVPLPPGAASIAVSGNVSLMTIASNLILQAHPNVYGIQISGNVRGESPLYFTITGNSLLVFDQANTVGIAIPSVTDNRGVIAGNYISGFTHPYSGTGGTFQAGPIQPGELSNFGGQGSTAYCVSCMVVSPTNNMCTAGGGGALAVKLGDGAWHCFNLQN
jgi:hypothetical protein